MPSILQLKFREVLKPIAAAKTKFGGQPFWLSDPVSPLSRRTGKPMAFIGQIRIPQDWLGDHSVRLAYIFMTGGGFDYNAIETWDPKDGETAVVLQTSGESTMPSFEPYPELLKRWDESGETRSEVFCEYEVEEIAVDEPAYMNQQNTDNLDDSARDQVVEPWKGNKIGGSPYWVQGEQIPYPEWRLLLQLEDGTYPFSLNLGTGVGYVFLNASCTEGQLLWQC